VPKGNNTIPKYKAFDKQILPDFKDYTLSEGGFN